MPLLPACLVWLTAYLVGSIPFGWLIARSRGVDIQTAGSGNIGATNVARVLGKPLGILVFALDFAKGALSVALAGPLLDLLTGAIPAGETLAAPAGTVEVVAGLAAFLGHCFPVTLGFKGGKGVATAAGVVVVLFPLPALVALLAFAAALVATRMVSLAALFAALVLVGQYLLARGPFDATDPRTLFALLVAAILFWRHRGNIQRIRAGSERQITPQPAFDPAARMLHTLSLGLWCGATTFFSFVVAVQLFRGFEAVGDDVAHRPNWLPLAEEFSRVDPAIGFNGPKDQGSRVAGHAVGRIFPIYFTWQYACAAIALGSSLAWPRLRPWLVGVAFAAVIAGWALDHKVVELRVLRSDATDAFLRGGDADAMLAARAQFLLWHFVALFLNFVTAGLVIVATALAGTCPAVLSRPPESTFRPAPTQNP